MLDKRGLRRPLFYDWAMSGSTIYFSSVYYNALCKADLKNDEVEILATFPDIPAHKGNSYFGIYKKKSSLLLAPLINSNDFLIYDIEDSKFSRLSNIGGINFTSTAVFLKDDYIYIVSRKTAQITQINLVEHSVQHMAYEEFIADDALIVELVRVNNLIYIPVNQKKVLLSFDLTTREFRNYPFPENVSFIGSICYFDGNFWITGETRKLYTWNLNNTIAYEVIDYPNDIKLYYKRKIFFGSSFVYDNILWLFPLYSDSILKYKLLTNQFEKIEIEGEEESEVQIDEEMKRGRYLPSKYCMVQRYDDKVFFLSAKTRLFYELDLITDKIYKHDFRVRNIYNNQLYPPPMTRVIPEASYTKGLECLIKTSMQEVNNIEMKCRKAVGEKIYNHIICNIDS